MRTYLKEQNVKPVWEGGHCGRDGCARNVKERIAGIDGKFG